MCLCVRALPQVSKAWLKSLSSPHHTSVFFWEKGDRYWLIKALCLCQLALEWQWINEKKWLHGLVREIGYFSFNRSDLKKWVWKMAWIDGALRTPSGETITDSLRQPCVHQRMVNKVRLWAHSRLTAPPINRLKDLKWTDDTTRVARDLDCMMDLHLTKSFIYIQKCIKMSMLGDEPCDFYSTIFVEKRE